MIHVGRPAVLFQARAGANQTLASTSAWHPISLQIEDHDTAGAHSTTAEPARFTAPWAGLFRCSGTVLFNSAQATTAGTVYRWVNFFKNANQLPGGSFQTYTGQLLVVAVPPVLVSMAAGDYVDLRATSGLANTVTYADGGVIASSVTIEQAA